MLRGTLLMARQEECDAITGADEVGQHVEESLVGDVRDVHHHAQPVHLADHLLPEVGEPVVLRRLARAVGPRRVVGVGQGEIPRSHLEERPQDREIGIDGIAALDAHQDRDVPTPPRVEDPGRRRGQFQVARVLGGLLAHGVDLLQRAADRFGGGVAVAIGPDGKEDAGDMAGAHARNIDLPVIVLLGRGHSPHRGSSAWCRRADRR